MTLNLQAPTSNPSSQPTSAPTIAPKDGYCSDSSGRCSLTDLSECACAQASPTSTPGESASESIVFRRARALQEVDTPSISRSLRSLQTCSASNCSACDKSKDCPEGAGECTWIKGPNGGCFPATSAVRLLPQDCSLNF